MLKVIGDFAVDNSLNTEFITFDIETISKNNKLIPYLICAYNGTDYITSFGNNVHDLFSNFIKELLTFIKKDNKTITVYAHNFSSFDGVFLLKHLLPFGIVEPLLYNGKLITVKLKILIEEENSELIKYNGKTIIFKDSYLLLPVSLRNLALTYKCTESKGIFPFKLNDILYSGSFPRFEFFKNINISDYLNQSQLFTNKIWNFKDEAIKYCKLDCLILFEILTLYNQMMFNEFNVNIHKILTLPALAFKIFKTHFLPENAIYQLHGTIEQNIRGSFTGGAVDVYKPHNRITPWLINSNIKYQKLYCYDVNALYPTVMANMPMPIGLPQIFEGNISKYDPNPFGFFYCEITSPPYLEHPLLQRRIKTNDGVRTIAGLGSWIGWVFSEEMYNAMKFGYKFNIIKGYLFKKGNLFTDYVNKMYDLRLLYPKGHPMNQNAKLLNNSLYGKFGMKDVFTKIEILDNVTVEDREFISAKLDLYQHDVIDIVELEKHTLILVKNKIES